MGGSVICNIRRLSHGWQCDMILSNELAIICYWVSYYTSVTGFLIIICYWASYYNLLLGFLL